MWAALLCCSGCFAPYSHTTAEQTAFAALHARAERVDRAGGTAIYEWLADHEPSRLDVARGAPALAASFDRGAKVVAVGSDLRRACRLAKRDRALLLAFVRATSPERDLALDCGFTLERDAAAVVVAPR